MFQIEENYSLMFRYLGNAHVKVTIFDSNGKENALCSEMKDAFISQHKAFSLSMESKYCNLKMDISKISKHQGIIFFYLIGINKCRPSRLRVVLFIFSITPTSSVIPLGASSLTVAGICPNFSNPIFC